MASNWSKVPVKLRRLKELAAFVLAAEGCADETQFSMAFVDDEEMARLNMEFRSKEGPTDVLSFAMADELDPAFLGEVIIAPAEAGKNAAESGTTVAEETETLLVHGILHLVGYDHGSPDGETEMFAHQEQLLKSFAGRGR